MADYPIEALAFSPDVLTIDSVSMVHIEAALSSEAVVNSGATNIYMTHASVGIVDVMLSGVWQPGYNGTVTPNGRGFDYAITTHPDLAPGLWGVLVEAFTDGGDRLYDGWTFTAIGLVAIDGVRTVGRRIIEVTFDDAVRVRSSSIKLVEPDDRYTPVDWVAAGGLAGDAANPDNYTIARPATGDLVEPGEAIPLQVIKAWEDEESWSEVGGVIYSTKVRLLVDYQMTARASYELTVEDLASATSAPMTATTTAFTGHIVSHVVRGSLHLWDLVSGLHRRDDTDGTGDLLKVFTGLQEVLDRWLEDVDAFFLELCDIDKLREDFLDTLLHDLGNPFEGVFSLTAIKKRRLAAILVQMYREKGTCEGIVNAVQFFVEVTLSGCLQPWEDVWRLADGSYPTPTGPDQDELGIDTLLGPGTDAELYSFMLLSPIALTAEQREQINAIATYMKPANAIYYGIDEP